MFHLQVNGHGELFNKIPSLRAEALQAGGVAVALAAVEVLARDEAQRVSDVICVFNDPPHTVLCLVYLVHSW